MPVYQQAITIAVCILATLLSRFLPFLIFRDQKETPAFVKYLGDVLPSAVFALLVVYCMKDVDFAAADHALPDSLALIVTLLVHAWRRNMMLTMFLGTAAYMLFLALF